jgi:hypothetical protein
MKLKPLIHAVTGLALFGLMSLNPAVQAQTALDEDAVGKVLMIQGKVLAYSEGGDQRVLRGNAAIYEGDTVETIGEGAVVLTFADNTQWDVFDQSKLSILEYVYTPEGSSQDSASFKFHEGQATYSSGKLGQRGAEIAIQMEDKTVYPEGSIFSFFMRQRVSVVNIVQGNGRIVTRTRATTRIRVGQWATFSPAVPTPMVATSAAAAVSVIQTVVSQTVVTSGPSTGAAVAVVSTLARTIVRTVVRASVSALRRRTVVSQTVATTQTTVVAAAGAGGSGHPVGYIPATTSSLTDNIFTLINDITGTSTGQNFLIQPGGTPEPVASPSQ